MPCITCPTMRQFMSETALAKGVTGSAHDVRLVSICSCRRSDFVIMTNEKFWEIVELRSLDASLNLLDALPSAWRAVAPLRLLAASILLACLPACLPGWQPGCLAAWLAGWQA